MIADYSRREMPNTRDLSVPSIGRCGSDYWTNIRTFYRALRMVCQPIIYTANVEGMLARKSSYALSGLESL